MINVFIGYDERERIGLHVFISSLIDTSSEPLSITPLSKSVLEKSFGYTFANGSNAFTTSRFLVPSLCKFVGRAIFLDGIDMLCRSDIAGIFNEASPLSPISVVKHDYKTKHPRKYVGTSMEADNTDYERKQWASVMVFNCWHKVWQSLTPEKVSNTPTLNLLQLKFLADNQIHGINEKWNWLADEHGRNDHAKIVHFTAGIPIIDAYSDVAHADEWYQQLGKVNYVASPSYMDERYGRANRGRPVTDTVSN